MLVQIDIGCESLVLLGELVEAVVARAAAGWFDRSFAFDLARQLAEAEIGVAGEGPRPLAERRWGLLRPRAAPRSWVWTRAEGVACETGAWAAEVREACERWDVESASAWGAERVAWAAVQCLRCYLGLTDGAKQSATLAAGQLG